MFQELIFTSQKIGVAPALTTAERQQSSSYEIGEMSAMETGWMPASEKRQMYKNQTW